MSGNNEEPSEGNTKESYDYIILGTGLIESIISCSLVKYGKKVLHLDANDAYGEIFLSSNLSTTMKYLHSLGNNEDEARNTPHYASENNGFMKLDEKSSNFLLIPESNELQRQINLKQLQLLEIYQRDLNRFYPSSKRSSYLHPAYYHLLTKPPGTPPPQTTSNEKNAECLHPAYFPLITNEAEEQFLGLFLHSDRYFNIDLSPKMVYCSGKLINSIIQSKIHHYLEFKPMNSFYYFLSASLSSPAATAAAASSAYQLWKVPSNKNDIFLSTHLTAIEKRCLMKFYQYIFDWSQLQKGKNLYLFNENELKTGRALYRPQNKSVAAEEGITTKPEEDGLTSPAPSSSSNEKKEEEEDNTEKRRDILYNQQNFKEKSFLEFLQAFKLSEKLQSIIIYALCLHYSSAERGGRGGGGGEEAAVIDSAVFDAVLSKSIHETLQDLSLYFNSVGIFGETAFLAPLYGISETVQGFCRMSAVWGSTFMLRRSLSLIRTISQENSDPVTKDEKKEPEERDLKEAEVSTKGEEKESSSSVKPADIIIGKLLEVKDNEGNEYTCKKIISNFRYLPSIVNCAPYFSYHGVMLLAPSSSSIAVASLFPEERTVGIIPPHFSYSGEDGQIHALENEYTVYLHQYDKSTEATAEGMTVLHIHTLISDQSIERDRRLIHWEQRANEQFPRCQRLTEHLEKIVKLREQMKFIDWKPVANSTETVVKDPATTTTTTTILPFSIVFSRAFLRPIAEHLWQNHPSDENLLITGSFNYSSLHLEEEVETAKRVVYELLERGEIKSTGKAWGEFELFEEEKTGTAANEEDQEDGEDGDETNSRPLPSSTGMEESEEATDANEYMQIYQKILASSSGSGGVEAPNTLNSSDNNPEPASHNHNNNKNEED